MIQFNLVPLLASLWAKLNNQLNALVHVVRESIEGSKMVDDLNQEEHSIVTLLQVVQQTSP